MTLTRVIAAVVEGVFNDVAALRDGLLVNWSGSLNDSQVNQMRPQIQELLDRPNQIALGMGIILEPGILASHPLRLEWWQSVNGTIQQLDADLNPRSLGFYDYAAADWFEVPRRTGLRHVLGPYVDVHGTERYILTLTMPILAGSTFLGVAGADVPVSRLERLVLQQVEPEQDFVVLNAEHRVVLSTRPDYLPGALLDPPEDAEHLAAVGWWVRHYGAESSRRPHAADNETA